MPQQTQKKKKWISLGEAEACDNGEARLTRPRRAFTRTLTHPFASRFAPALDEGRPSKRNQPQYLSQPRRAAELQEIHESRDLQACVWRVTGRACSSPAALSELQDPDLSHPIRLCDPKRPPDPSLRSKHSAGWTSADWCSAVQEHFDPVQARNSEARHDWFVEVYPDDRLRTALPAAKQLRGRDSTGNGDRRDSHDSGIAFDVGAHEDLFRPNQEKSGGGLTSRRNDMATVPFRTSGDSRRPNRYENRPPMSTVLCRNGPQCRKFQEGTCGYNHDFTSMAPNGFNGGSAHPAINYAVDAMLSQDLSKRALNVESPAFTPKIGNAQPVRLGITPKAVTAAAFTPRGSGTVTPAANLHSKEPSLEFYPQAPTHQAFQEFVPGSSFLSSPQMETVQPQLQQQIGAFSDPFLAQQGIANIDATQAQMNPYAQQASANQHFFQDATSFKHLLNYHLYSSIGPRRENLMSFQRSTTDFFIPDDLREDLQRKSEATLQTFANSTLPASVEYFHSLVAIDTNTSKGPSTYGFPSSVYKAVSGRDGHTYALRRIEGFRLTSEAAIRTINGWKRVNNASVVQIHDAFTGRWFGDSSLIIVTDYHPLSKTLAEKHYTPTRGAQRMGVQTMPESDLWGYMVQISSAIKSIHEGGLAAQTVMPSKILMTAKNRIRLNGCGVLDVLNHEQRKPIHELQRIDLQALGRLMLGLAARNQMAHENTVKALSLISRSYSERLRSSIAWLLAPPSPGSAQPAEKGVPGSDYNVHTFLTSIADKVMSAFDSTMHLEDEMNSHLMRELENGRLVRLLAKMNVILERPDTSSTPNATNNPALLDQPSSAWSETGERYYLKLFRDYVFHQVDHEGRPVLDLGHIITCLNKLDAGIDEKIQLISRDEQNQFIVSYKEVKRGFESAWADISKASNPARR